jgi:predicted lipoprotein with Yx(FWY)xxD motif
MKNALAIAALLLAAQAQAQDLKNTGGVLATAAGMTVYTFEKDVAGSGKSACAGPCIQNWPAVAAPEKVAEPYSVITRDDGSKQLAYKGKPLYTFVKDAKAGDRTGDNFKDVWHVVKD